MPIADTDIVIIHRNIRNGQNNIEIEFEWKDSIGNSKGIYTVSWLTFQEMVNSVEEQTIEDIVRTMVTQLINRNTGAFRIGVFDSLTGKSFEIQQRVREII